MCQTEFDLPDQPASGAAPVREFLGWETSLVDSVSRWLLDLGDELASTLVVVPTANSGRRLRMALASGGADGGGVIAPHVVPPSRLFAVEGVATRLESLWAWVRVIQGINIEDFPRLLPNHAPGSMKGFSSALALARPLQTLRDQLADGDASFRDAGFHSAEKERWQELGELESAMLAKLGQWGLRDATLAKRERAGNPELPPGVRRVVVAGVPDPTPLALRALRAVAERGLPVTVLVHAPASDAASFDPWGVPRAEVWEKKSIDVPHWRQRLHVEDSASDAAKTCVRVFGEQQTNSNEAALVLCDPTFATALEKDFAAAGWPLYDPEGRGLADSGLMRLLRAACDLARPSAPFAALQAFVRLPGAESFLPEKSTRHSAAKLLDDLQQKHLPETVQDALALTYDDKAKAVVRTVVGQFSRFSGGGVLEDLRQRMITWLNAADAPTSGAAEPRLAETLDAAARLIAHGEAVGPAEILEMAAEALQSAAAGADGERAALDLQGWLEISYDAAPHMVLAGMHEECVPDGKPDDVFLPDSLRKNLGLRDSAGRFARDAFLFHTALRSRDASGRVDVVVARFNDTGEPRKPSRLVMRQRGERLASVVRHLFSEPDSTASRGGPWTRDWTLDLPVVENPYLSDPPRRVSPSALGDYLHCPLRFYLRRILKMERYESGKQEMDAMDFGNLCHKVLEIFGADGAVNDCTDEKTIRDYLCGVLEQRVETLYGKRLSLPLMVQMESARERLAAFAGRQAACRAEGWRIVETEFAVGRGSAGEPLEWRLAGHPLTMVIDRIDRHEDGKRWRVWDYKTSGKAVNPENQHLKPWDENENRPQLGDLLPPKRKNARERRWAGLQLPIYAAFVQDHFKTGVLPEIGYVNLPRAAGDTGFALWSGFDQALLGCALGWAQEAIGRIKAGDFERPAVLPAGECDWDDFAELAPDGLAAAFGI